MKNCIKFFKMRSPRGFVIVGTIIAFTLIGLASCEFTSGGSLEVTNGHTATAYVAVAYAYEITMWNKRIEPGEKAVWTVEKNGKYIYVVEFADNIGVSVEKSIMINGGEMQKVTVKP